MTQKKEQQRKKNAVMSLSMYIGFLKMGDLKKMKKVSQTKKKCSELPLDDDDQSLAAAMAWLYSSAFFCNMLLSSMAPM